MLSKKDTSSTKKWRKNKSHWMINIKTLSIAATIIEEGYQLDQKMEKTLESLDG
jgi:hypothetical protein